MNYDPDDPERWAPFRTRNIFIGAIIFDLLLVAGAGIAVAYLLSFLQ